MTIRRLEERARELEAALAEKARGLPAQLVLSITQASGRLRWLRGWDAGPQRAPSMWSSLLAFPRWTASVTHHCTGPAAGGAAEDRGGGAAGPPGQVRLITASAFAEADTLTGQALGAAGLQGQAVGWVEGGPNLLCNDKPPPRNPAHGAGTRQRGSLCSLFRLCQPPLVRLHHKRSPLLCVCNAVRCRSGRLGCRRSWRRRRRVPC